VSVVELATWTLLVIGVGVEILCVVGVVAMDDVFDRLHFLGPASTIGTLAIVLAILFNEPFSTNGIKTLLVGALLILTSPVLTHATARAARVRQYGHWQAVPEEEVDTE